MTTTVFSAPAGKPSIWRSRKSKFGTGVSWSNSNALVFRQTKRTSPAVKAKSTSPNLSENPLAGGQTVVVAQQDDVRNIQTIEDVALPLELVAHAEIGQIARVDHEVDVVAGVDGFHGIFGLVVPPLRVADLRETDRPPALARRLDAGDVAGVDTRRTVDAGIVGVVFDLAGGQEHNGQKRKEFGFHNGCFTDCNRKLLGEHPTCALKKTPKND